MRSREHTASRHPIEADAAQVLVRAATGTAMREFLTRVRRAVATLPGTLVAAAPAGWELTLQGQLNGWWAEAVDANLIPQLEAIWRHGYHEQTSTVAGLDTLPEYLAQVRDRLVPGEGPHTSPSIPDDAFNMAREVLARGLATGATKGQIAQSLASTFSWDNDATMWREQKATVDATLSPLLDAYGNPGDPARELAKRSDPRIAALIQQRNVAQARIDAVESTWAARASRIARTESTGGLNGGAWAALAAEGVTCKEWASHLDRRTRLSHAEADGQKRPHAQPFEVGGWPLMFPGDPTAPPHLSVNCRCALVGCEDRELPADQRIPDAAMPTDFQGQEMPWSGQASGAPGTSEIPGAHANFAQAFTDAETLNSAQRDAVEPLLVVAANRVIDPTPRAALPALSP